jgi:hypothetical protein
MLARKPGVRCDDGGRFLSSLCEFVVCACEVLHDLPKSESLRVLKRKLTREIIEQETWKVSIWLASIFTHLLRIVARRRSL